MVHLDIRPSEAIIRPLLQVKSMELVGLRRGTGHQPVENRWVVFDTRAKQKKLRKILPRDNTAFLNAMKNYHVNGDQKAKNVGLKIPWLTKI